MEYLVIAGSDRAPKEGVDFVAFVGAIDGVDKGSVRKTPRVITLLLSLVDMRLADT
jgi:hypothetical protein